MTEQVLVTILVVACIAAILRASRKRVWCWSSEKTEALAERERTSTPW